MQLWAPILFLCLHNQEAGQTRLTKLTNTGMQVANEQYTLSTDKCSLVLSPPGYSASVRFTYKPQTASLARVMRISVQDLTNPEKDFRLPLTDRNLDLPKEGQVEPMSITIPIPQYIVKCAIILEFDSSPHTFTLYDFVAESIPMDDRDNRLVSKAAEKALAEVNSKGLPIEVMWPKLEPKINALITPTKNTTDGLRIEASVSKQALAERAADALILLGNARGKYAIAKFVSDSTSAMTSLEDMCNPAKYDIFQRIVKDLRSVAAKNPSALAVIDGLEYSFSNPKRKTFWDSLFAFGKQLGLGSAIRSFLGPLYPAAESIVRQVFSVRQSDIDSASVTDDKTNPGKARRLIAMLQALEEENERANLVIAAYCNAYKNVDTSCAEVDRFLISLSPSVGLEDGIKAKLTGDASAIQGYLADNKSVIRDALLQSTDPTLSGQILYQSTSMISKYNEFAKGYALMLATVPEMYKENPFKDKDFIEFDQWVVMKVRFLEAWERVRKGNLLIEVAP